MNWVDQGLFVLLVIGVYILCFVSRLRKNKQRRKPERSASRPPEHVNCSCTFWESMPGSFRENKERRIDYHFDIGVHTTPKELWAAELHKAVEREDYELAAKLRDKIRGKVVSKGEADEQ